MKTRPLSALVALGLALAAAPLFGAERNWTPPAGRMAVQALSEQTMAAHHELISVTFHGVPPGQSKLYTMFGGSYLDRIGNADDPDDILVIVNGMTILDPRWHKLHDPVPKYVVQLPLREASGENVGLLVLAFHKGTYQSDREYLDAANAIRDHLAEQIPSYAGLFATEK